MVTHGARIKNLHSPYNWVNGGIFVQEGKKRTILAFVLATLAGTALHFGYDFFPNLLTALFCPVVESVWEHGKLLFWPGLIGTLWLSRTEGGVSSRLAAIVLSFAALQTVGCLYCVTLGGQQDWVNIGLYIISMALLFWLPAPLDKWLQGRGTGIFAVLCVFIAILLCVFTFYPPDTLLFADLSAYRTWTVIPV